MQPDDMRPHRRPGNRNSRRQRLEREQILRESTICWICGHDGADVVDHVRALVNGGSLEDRANKRPAHGNHGCPTCTRKCNNEKGGSLDVAAFRPEPHSREWE